MSKYHAVPTVIQGIRARRYCELRLLEKADKIRALTLQPRYPLKVNDLLVATYVADFQYFIPETGEVIVEDFKGVETPMFRLKKKLVKALYGFDVCCVK